MRDDLRALSPLLLIAGGLIIIALLSAVAGCKRRLGGQYDESTGEHVQEVVAQKRYRLDCHERLLYINTDTCSQVGNVTTYDYGSTTYACFCERNF